MSRRAYDSILEKLDAAKDQKIGRGQRAGRRRTVIVDLTGVADEYLLPVLDAAASTERQRANALRASRAATAKQEAARKARADLWRAFVKRQHPARRDNGTAARVLAFAADWVTQYEIRTQVGVPRYHCGMVLNRLWREGRLLKRLNPGRAANRLQSVGNARCEFQFKRAEKETAGE